MEHVLIAGGSGFVGEILKEAFLAKGWTVVVLTRDKKRAAQYGYSYWNPLKKEIEHSVIEQTTVLVNLAGAGIADKRWTSKRVRELYDSRIIPTDFLVKSFQNAPNIKQVIQVSGGTCYGYQGKTCHSEHDAYGNDTIGQLTKSWEEAALEFAHFADLTMMRLGVVFGKSGGAIPKLAQPIKFGFGSALGNGKQIMPWIHEEDVSRFCIWAIDKQAKGIYNLCAGNNTNEEVTHAVAKAVRKRIILPKVPKAMLFLLLGKRSEIILKGMCVSNQKLVDAGFTFQHTDLQATINSIFVP